MTDWVADARTARQQLAQGLGVLQTPGLPDHLSSAAEPIAQAMSQLHRIESTGGAALPESAPVALLALRRALGLLQSGAVAHPACDQAIECVARSLGQVHGLAQQAEHANAAPGPAAALAGTVLSEQGQAGPRAQFPQQPPAAQYPPPDQAQQWSQPQAQYAPQPPYQSGQQAPQYAQPAAQYAQQAPPTLGVQYAPQQPVTGAQYAQPQQPPGPPQYAQPQQPPQAPYPVQPYPAQPAARAPQFEPAAQAMPQAAPAQQGGRPPLRVEAELGAHSATNFYKGLSGNDIIDSGGIFVATYQIPPVGSDVVVKVSLPGGYEFEALGMVAWTREAPNSGTDAPPGFGARFTQISPEGRQLVYRYVRNREPLFHDDL